ncbi:MAG: chromosomal replication initiator protein DnaA [Acidobacteria bacterium]|nr:chromosomal replication initiator protein DnaA [Acidobacteriota bacterium]
MEEAENLWARALVEVRGRMPSPGARAWIEGTRPVRMSVDSIVLAAPSPFAREWLQSHYGELLTAALSAAAGRSLSLEFTALEPGDSETALEPQSPAPGPAPAPPRSPEAPALNPKYTFESFVTGPSNRFAHAASLAVAEQPARSYNPLFIYGGAGLGKTHMLHAIGHQVRLLFPTAVVRYVSSEQFMNEFIQGVREERMPAFRRRYREADLLLVDDIQFLARGEQTQEEFFHTFNALHNDGRQIVISSDRAPKEIAPLEDRLRTRFEWGLITDVQPPDLETRVAILQKKAAAEGFQVPDEVLAYIAERVQNNIRELEGRLIRVVSYASLSRLPLTMELAQEVLRPLLPPDGPDEIPADLIIAECAGYFGISRDDLGGPSRVRQLVHARQVAMYLCRELTPLSLPKVGEVFGGRDHTTVMHAEGKIKRLMGERRVVYSQVQELTARIRGRAAGELVPSR